MHRRAYCPPWPPRTAGVGLLIVLAGACTDGGDDAPGEAGLHATQSMIYLGIDGTSRPRPIDLSGAIVAAHVPRDGGGWEVYPGVGDGDGNVVVPGVPAGPRWLRIQPESTDHERGPRDEYVWSDADDIDFSLTRIGRPDPSYPSASTPLVLDADGLEPWAAGTDLLGVYSPNLEFVNYFHQDGDGVTGFPAAGATALETTFDWRGLIGPLADASSGDRTVFSQYRRLASNGLEYYAPVASFEARYTQTDGATTRVEGRFTPGPSLSYRLTWKRSAFEALRTAIHPDTQASGGHAFAVYTSSGLTDDDWHWATAPIEVIATGSRALDGTDDVDFGELVVRNPFPRESLFRFHDVFFTVPFDVDGHELRMPTHIGQYERLPDGADGAAPVAPLVSPVRSLQIAGRDAWQPQRDVGLEPELRWEAPATGAVRQYRILVAEPFGRYPTPDPDLGTDWTRAATLLVPGDVTSVTLPHELLVDGRRYVVVVRAIKQPSHVDVRETPYRRALPYAYADAVSALFQP